MGNPRDPEAEITKLRARVLELERGLHANQLARSIAENSPSNIMLVDLEAKIQYINHTVPGVTPDELKGVLLYDIIEPRFHAQIRRALDSVAQSQLPDRYETHYTSPSGDKSWWESSVGPVLQDSELTGFAIVSTNTTEQRHRTEEQERFFNLSVDMMCISDFNGYFVRVNHAFQDTVGYGQELLEQPYADFLHPDDVEKTEAVLQTMIAGKVVVDFTHRFRSKEGEYRLFLWKGVADLKRQVIYAVARDITETHALQEQLQQSKKMEAIGKLAGGIAHDFNNLLLAVQGNIELALEEPELAPTTLPDALLAAERAAALTRQLLTFSRDQALTPTVLELDSLLDSVMNLLKRLLPENISVHVQHASNAPSLVADQSQLEQVVVNLCLNARDAMPDGGTLHLTVEGLDLEEDDSHCPPIAAGQYVSLMVTDTGHGMTPEVRKQIFEPFFTTKGVGHGTGLGLATVYGIVQQHGGFLNVESTPGEGTTFRVYLPASDQALTIAPSAPSSVRSVPGGQETILVAEDEPMVRQVVVRMLTQAGYTVLAASDGVDACQMFAANADKISLVLLDVVMPRLGGPEAAARIRELQPGVQVLFATGHVPTSGDMSKLKQEQVLSKPYQRKQLLRLVRTALEPSQPSITAG